MITDREAWAVEATHREAKEAVIFLLSVVEPEAKDERAQVMSRIMAGRGYTKAELALAMRELPFDEKAAHNFGRGFNPADVERIVTRHRTLRTRLLQKMSEAEMNDLLVAFPKELRKEDFGMVEYTSKQEKLYRHFNREAA